VCSPTTTTGETTAKGVKLWHSDKELRLLGATGIPAWQEGSGGGSQGHAASAVCTRDDGKKQADYARTSYVMRIAVIVWQSSNYVLCQAGIQVHVHPWWSSIAI
jgi:hypothetical protein